ncbi:E3 ubiquitin-protein ligase Topors-like [Prorops nasuta]|uniref:E3 ubiquitin-protein ligase Topors-like n=1 Tax=Prorops nasuta TaxID=863751 RepID=UPI0034CDC3CC
MESLIVAKDSAAIADENIKSEDPVQSPGGSERSDGATSPPPNCSICLGKLVNTSFTDSCLHQFCFTCLLQWSKIKTECPLCKQTFKSIIHNVRSEEDYDQYHVPRDMAPSLQQPSIATTLDVSFEVDENWQDGFRHFFYRTTMTAGNRRLRNSPQMARQQLPNIHQQASGEGRRLRVAAPILYRRSIYVDGIWSNLLPDVSRHFRNSTATYYRQHPGELNRLVPWLNRELQALLTNVAPHVAYVLQVIMQLLTEYDIRSTQFREAIRPYFGMHTSHFIYELLNFARSNLDMIGYDQRVTYMRGLSNEYVPRIVSPTSSSNSSSTEDSDVRVLDEAIDLSINFDLPSVGPHMNNMPGPSTIGQAFHLEIPNIVPEVLTVSSSSSSSENECEIVGYVKPRQDRTPEIIEVVSSDPEDLSITNTNDNSNKGDGHSSPLLDHVHPSTSHYPKRKSNRSYSSTESDSSSDSSSVSDSDSVSESDYNSKRRSYQCGKKTLMSGRRKENLSSYERRKAVGKNSKSRNAFSNSEESDSKSSYRKKGKKSQSTKRKRLSISSDSSFHISLKAKVSEERSRRGKYSTRSSSCLHKNTIKWEKKHKDLSRSSSESSGSDTSYRSCQSSRQYRSNKTSSSYKESDADKKQLNSIENDKKAKKSRKTKSRSHSSDGITGRKSRKRSREHRRGKRNYSSEEETTLINKDSKRKCSHKKHYKYKDDYREKEKKSQSKNVQSNSSKGDSHSAYKYTEFKYHSDSHDFWHKRDKEPTFRRRSRSESKSKSKKRKRRIRSSSSSN